MKQTKQLKMMMMLVLLLCFFWAIRQGVTQEHESFVVTINDQKTKVVAPKTHLKMSSFIFENRTLSNIFAQIVDASGRLIKNITIPANSKKIEELELEKNKAIYLVPMAPAGQELELKVGKETYEIPAI